MGFSGCHGGQEFGFSQILWMKENYLGRRRRPKNFGPLFFFFGANSRFQWENDEFWGISEFHGCKIWHILGHFGSNWGPRGSRWLKIGQNGLQLAQTGLQLIREILKCPKIRHFPTEILILHKKKDQKFSAAFGGRGHFLTSVEFSYPRDILKTPKSYVRGNFISSKTYACRN